jgi:hypothetical protein
MVKTKGMSMLNSIEDFGKALENILNHDSSALHELGWELLQVQVLSEAEPGGNNGVICTYRRPKA